MINNNTHEFNPDYLPPPGETLQELLNHYGMSHTELSGRIGRTYKTVNEIVNGKAAINAETALRLEKVFGVSAGFWTNLEQQYRVFLARQEEARQLSNATSWLKQLPIKEMIQQGWINGCADRIDQLREVLSFFGVSELKDWSSLCPEADFRETTAFKSKPAAVAAWLRAGEVLALRIQTEPFSKSRLMESIPRLRSLTLLDTGLQHRITEICADSGIAVVFIPELPGTRLCGATRWIKKDKALIQLSMRYKTEDQLWFTFFHEIAHVLYHGKRSVFLDDKETVKDQLEKKANEYAAAVLIPESEYRSFCSTADFSEKALHQFARRIGISPGIVVGRLQHDGLCRWDSRLNQLKKKIDIK